VSEITITEMIENVLRNIGSINGIQASALISTSGLMMASEIYTTNVDAETIGGMVAMLMRSAVHTSKELDIGEIEYILLNSTKGKIILKKATSNAILTVLTDTNTDVNFALKEMKKARAEITNIFAKI
jgi:predicted regulator of Ras-like GTPase activity (Roadblock/LC7/MglB family)